MVVIILAVKQVILVALINMVVAITQVIEQVMDPVFNLLIHQSTPLVCTLIKLLTFVKY
mgnify:CR=1 FL=1